MKNLITLLTTVIVFLFVNSKLYSQYSNPLSMLICDKGSTDYNSIMYKQGRTYKCEDWLQSYMTYYQGNLVQNHKLPKPSLLVDAIKSQAIEANKVFFVFDLHQVKVFPTSTDTNIIKQYTSRVRTKGDLKPFEKFYTHEVIVSTGLVFPGIKSNDQDIKFGFQENDPILSLIDRVDITDNKGNGLCTLTPINPEVNMKKIKLIDLSVSVFLTNGKKYYYKISNRNCVSFPFPTDIITSVYPEGYDPNNDPDNDPNPDDPVGPTIETDPSNPEVIHPEEDPDNYDDVVIKDCIIQPSYLNNPFTGQSYKAKFEFPQINPNIVNVITKEVKTWITGDFYVTTYVDEFTTILDPYESISNPAVHGSFGELNTAVYLNPEHNKVTKPIIITDGIDFTGDRRLSDILERFGGNEMITLMWDGGYDVIIVDFKGGADFMQRNAFALIELMRSLRMEQEVQEIEALIGPSMGGQIARYALNYWEQKLVGEYGPHKVKTFVSADSPWKGANIPPSIAALGDLYEDKSASAKKMKIKLNSPAARQLLLHHTFGNINSDDKYFAKAHPYRGLWVDEINDLGDKIDGCEKVIALADGAGNAKSTFPTPHKDIFCIEFESFWCDFTQKFRTIDNDKEMIDADATILCDFSERVKSVRALEVINNYDSAPGSPYNIQADLKTLDGTTIIVDGHCVKIKVTPSKEFCFIPTFSALDLPVSFLNSNIGNSTTSLGSGLQGFTLPNSRFDAVFFDNVNSEHTSMSTQDSPGSLPFLLQQFQYQTTQNTKCELLSQITLSPIELNSNNLVENICFPFNNLEITNVTNNYCNFTITPDGSVSQNIPSNCEAMVNICVKLTGCPNEVCLPIFIKSNYGMQRIVSNQNPNALTSVTNDIDAASRSVSAKSLNTKLSVYPNPTSNLLNIVFDGGIDYIPVVVDVLGIKTYFQENAKSIDLSRLNAGIYSLQIADKTGTILDHKKIIKVE